LRISNSVPTYMTLFHARRVASAGMFEDRSCIPVRVVHKRREWTCGRVEMRSGNPANL
jgi:hypothetical protein